MAINTVFTIAGAKGGVGKTTSTINLAASLREMGHSVIAIEMDLPMPNFLDFLDLERDPLTGQTLPDVLAGDANIHDAVYETTDGIPVVPSVSDMEEYEEYETGSFSGIIDKLRWFYDIILIDTPAGYSKESVLSLEAGDKVLIVSTPRAASIQNAQKTIELANKYDAPVEGFILNKSGTGASPGVDSISETVSVDVLGHVPEDDAVPYSQDLGQPVVMKAPTSGAALAYRRLADSLVEQDNSQSTVVDSPTDAKTREVPPSFSESEESGEEETELLSENPENDGEQSTDTTSEPATDSTEDSSEPNNDNDKNENDTSHSENGSTMLGKLKTLLQ